MYQFNAKSNIVLGVMALFSLLGFLAVENNKVAVKQKWYKEKLQAARLAKRAADYLKNYRLEKGVFIDTVNDPNQTALIGQEFTLITTDRGYIEAKLTTTNPNFAAVAVDMLKQAGLKAGDYVAVAVTGSFPGLNIAVYAALETLHLKPIIITSVGASNWGANDPYFTWLDMEKVLLDANIFHFRSVAASMGGGLDRGRGLSPEGRRLIREAIKRNHLIFINEEHLEKSIDRRLTLYDKFSKKKPIRAYINVGGGIASLGSTINGKIIPAGLSKRLAMKNYPARGVIIEMAKREIPIIHLLNIRKLQQQYGLPTSPVPLPEPGEGEIFVQKRYDTLTTGLITLFLISMVILIYYADRRWHRLGTESVIPPGGNREETL